MSPDTLKPSSWICLALGLILKLKTHTNNINFPCACHGVHTNENKFDDKEWIWGRKKRKRRRWRRHNDQKCMCTYVHIYILIFQFQASRFSSFVLACCRFSLFCFLHFFRSFFFMVCLCVFRSSLTADGARLFLCVCMCWCGKVINQLYEKRKKCSRTHAIKRNGTYAGLWFLCKPISIRISIGLK